MKNFLFAFFFLFSCALAASAQKDSTKKKEEPKVRQFWMVILKTGPKDKEITDSVQRSKLFTGHFSNMERLYNDGVLKAAGPFGKNDFTWRGLFIIDCATKEEAETYLKTDPTVAAGIFIYDIVPWWSEPRGSFVPGKPEKKEKSD
jgi:uncharacterized protein YciI